MKYIKYGITIYLALILALISNEEIKIHYKKQTLKLESEAKKIINDEIIRISREQNKINKK